MHPLVLVPIKEQIQTWIGPEIDKELIDRCLFAPIEDLLSRPAKGFRAGLVRIGFSLARGQVTDSNVRLCEVLENTMEWIHAGSLIIDDIQDQSMMRRGQPSIHVKHGLGPAINSANWLYFWPFFSALQDFDPNDRLAFFEKISALMVKAHIGQAVDIGASIDQVSQERVPGLCTKAIELKTGALTGLALSFGGLVAKANPSTTEVLYQIGVDLGFALQCLNDLTDAKTEARELSLFRPSWIWAFAALNWKTTDYDRLIQAVKALPDRNELFSLFQESKLLEEATSEVARRVHSICQRVESEFPGSSPAVKQELLDRLIGLIQSYEEK